MISRISRFAALLALAATLCFSQVLGAPALRVSRTVTREEYVQFLDRLTAFYESASETDCCDRPPDVPNELIIKDGDRSFRLQINFLPWKYQTYPGDDEKPEEIQKKREEHSKEAKATVLATLKALRTSLDRQLETSSAAALNSKANQILSRHEFRKVRAPGLAEDWRDKFFTWLGKLLQKLGEKTPNFNFVSRLLLWTLIAIAVLLLGYLFKKYLENQEEAMSWRLSGSTAPPSAKSWSAWMQDARAAATKGNWRDAVRFAYWAGISSLETSGAWRPDRARTPREYLRLMSDSHQHRRVLQAMTSNFERIWYAQQPASESDFANSLRHLEEIGCR